MSAIENVPAAVNSETFAPPPAVAVDVALMVHTFAEVCTMEVMAEMFVYVKSVPEAVDRVAQLMSSLPVMVNEMAVEVDVAADAASVTVGG